MEATVSGLMGRQRRRPARSGRQLRPGRWRPDSRAGVLHGLEVQLPAAPVSAGTARHLAGQLLTDCGLTALTDDVLLVTSELAANAITASRDCHSAAIALWLARTPDGVLVAVADPAAADRLPRLLRLAPSAHPPLGHALLSHVPLDHAALAGDADDLGDLTEHGRGLTIAAAVADRVGWYRAGKWTVVWAEFRVSEEAGQDDDAGDPRTLNNARNAPAVAAEQHRVGAHAFAA